MNTFWGLMETLLMIDDDNPVAQRRWRMTVAMVLLFFLIHVLASYGLLRFIGVEGFVQNSELRVISNRLDVAANTANDIQDRLLQKSIIDVRIQQCGAIQKRYFTDRLRELTEEYYQTNKRGFDVPSCEALN